MRSLTVVLPASMCAMMPMLRIFSSGTSRAMWGSIGSLPPIVREGLVGLRHAVYVFLLLDGPAAHVGGFAQLVGQLLGHALFRPRTRVADQPPQRQADAPVLRHFDGNLVVGA